MAVTLTNISNNYNEYIALSTDDWPQDVPINSLLFEVDTNSFYYWCGTEWTAVGSAPSENAMGNIDVDPQPIDLGG